MVIMIGSVEICIKNYDWRGFSTNRNQNSFFGGFLGNVVRATIFLAKQQVNIDNKWANLSFLFHLMKVCNTPKSRFNERARQTAFVR